MPYLIVGNLKMNLLSPGECEKYLSLLRREAHGKTFSNVLGVLCPPYNHLPRFSHLPNSCRLGAQNMFWEKSGSYTGEVSPVMLKNEGVDYVILGHSERRLYGGETDEMVSLKLRLALKHMLIPIACVGETQEERDRGQTMDIIERQVRALFESLPSMQAEKVVVAYEPRWAIGMDVLPTTTDILQVKVFLRKLFTDLYDAKRAETIRVIYGGSVKSAFLPAVTWEADLDGALVGRESLFPHEIVRMMQMCEDYARSTR